MGPHMRPRQFQIRAQDVNPIMPMPRAQNVAIAQHVYVAQAASKNLRSFLTRNKLRNRYIGWQVFRFFHHQSPRHNHDLLSKSTRNAKIKFH
jgi:hypothetical protein